MKILKFSIVALVSLYLGACAQLQTLTQVATATVTPTEAIVAANAFNAVKAGATGFLTYCAANKTDVNCSANNRRNVIAYTRSGTAARNQIETYISTGGTSVPSALYNTLVAAVTNLKASPAANYTGAQ